MASKISSSDPMRGPNMSLTTTIAEPSPSDKGEEDLGLSLSEADDDDDDNTSSGRLQVDDEALRIEGIGDDDPQLRAYLDQSDSNNSNAIATSSEDDEEADIDDVRIEASEEQAILADFQKKNRGAQIPGPVSRRRLSESRHARSRNGKDSDDSESGREDDAGSEVSSWDDEFLEDYFDLPDNEQRIWHARQQKRQKSGNRAHPGHEADEDDLDGENNADDSYLWQYFFSSDEDANANASYEFFSMSNPSSRARQRRLSRSKGHHSSHPNAPHLHAPNKANGADASSDKDLPLKGRGPLPPGQHGQHAKDQPVGYVPSGESTDEDDGVPPERKRRRARGSKAIEVLGSNSFSARPPVLGSWRIRGDKNIGIIDGLTTRTLSPPPTQGFTAAKENSHFGNSLTAAAASRKDEPIDPFEGLDVHDLGLDAIGDFTDFGEAERKEAGEDDNLQINEDHQLDEEVSDLDLLELGDFLNTEALSSDDNDDHFEFDLVLDPDQVDTHNTQQHQQHQQHQNQQQLAAPKQFRSPSVSPYLYRNRMSNRNAPIPAFRNRGSPYVSNVAYPTENYSPAPRRPSRRGSFRKPAPHIRDQFASPSGHPRKKSKKPRGPPRGFPSQGTHGLDDTGDHDFIGELIEIGAISPLFEVD